MSVRIPSPKSSLVDQGQRISPEWHVFLSQLPNFVPFPAHFNSPGIPGQVAVDVNGNFYVCRAQNTWVKYAPTSTNF